MPRHRAVTPNRHLHTTIPPDLGLRLDLLLFSESQARVPAGAYQELLVRLLRQFFEEKEVDLAPFLGSLPGDCIVRAKATTLSVLITKLKEASHESRVAE